MTVPNKTAEEQRPAAVYRLYDTEGTLLYIGSAYDPEDRCKAHHNKEWWPQVARRTEEWHEDRFTAYRVETDAIRAERPTRNRLHTPEYYAELSARAQARAADQRELSKAAYLVWTGRRDAKPGVFALQREGLSWRDAMDEIDRCARAYSEALRDPASTPPPYTARAARVIEDIEAAIQGLGWWMRRRTIEEMRQSAAKALREEGADWADVAVVMAVANARLAELPYLLVEERVG